MDWKLQKDFHPHHLHLHHMAGADIQKKQMVFLVGIGRSGTTLLNKQLNGHPAVHALPEAEFLVFCLHRLRYKESISEADVEQVFHHIYLYTLTHPWVGWNFDTEKVKQQALEQAKQGNFSYQHLCYLIMESFEVYGLNKAEAGLFLDKNPSYTLYMKFLADFFPSAKFIWIVRDYHANVLSHKQNPDYEQEHVAFYAIRWKLFNKRAEKFAAGNKNVLYLRYEDLVLNNTAELNRIMQFMEIDTSAEIAYVKDVPIPDYKKVEVADRFKLRFEKKYNDLSKPVNTDRLNSWKSELTEQEIELCDALCGVFAKRFGYTEHKPVSAFRRCAVYIKACIPVLKAHINVRKDLLVYYFPIGWKLKRLRKRYEKLGLLKAE